MPITYGYQHTDFDSDQIERKPDEINFHQAIELFHSFPWVEQIKRIEDKFLTTYPSISFYKTDKHYLKVYATDDKGFNLYYQNDLNYGEQFIHSDISKNELGSNIDPLIISFFQNELIAEFRLAHVQNESFDSKKFKIRIKKHQTFYPLLFPLGFLALLISLNGYHFDLTFLFISTILSIPFFVPSIFIFYLKYTYWKNDSNQTIWFNKENKSVKIKKGRSTEEFNKKEIRAFDVIRTTGRYIGHYCYTRIKTKSNTFIITHLTLEPEKILTFLNTNKYKELEFFYPTIDLRILTEKQKNRNEKLLEKRRKRTWNAYEKWESPKLEEVISNNEYEAFAKEIAKEILNKREINSKF